VAEHRLDPLPGDPPDPGDHRLGAGAVDDGRLHSHPARPAVEHAVDVGAQVGPHVGRSGRAHPPEPVGRRRRDPTAEGAQQFERDRLVGDPQPHGGPPPGHRVGHPVASAQHQRERPGPARIGERPRGLGHLGGPVGERGRVGEVHDHRVVGRTALDRVEPRQRIDVGRVGAESVDGLGREGDEAAPPQHRDRRRDLVGPGTHRAEVPGSQEITSS
jgi:hypothetical protein